VIPVEVAGATILAIVGTQVWTGVAILVRKEGLNARDFMVIGFPVMLGALISFLPKAFFAQGPIILRTVLGNSMVVGVLIVLILKQGLGSCVKF